MCKPEEIQSLRLHLDDPMVGNDRLVCAGSGRLPCGGLYSGSSIGYHQFGLRSGASSSIHWSTQAGPGLSGSRPLRTLKTPSAGIP